MSAANWICLVISQLFLFAAGALTEEGGKGPIAWLAIMFSVALLYAALSGHS